MVISHKYRYIFIQIPQTACTAIGGELIEYYQGEKILRKHSNYTDFKRIVKDQEMGYTKFCGVRNPLDVAVSVYVKHKKNQLDAYTDPQKRKDSGGWVTKRELAMYQFTQNKGHNFGSFLKKFYPFSYTSNTNINAGYCDTVIRYEEINNDFTKILKRLNIKQVRNVPVVNVTNGKDKIFKYYNNNLVKKHAVRVFAPFMAEWNYRFPKDWDVAPLSTIWKLEYKWLKAIRYYYYKYYNKMPEKINC